VQLEKTAVQNGSSCCTVGGGEELDGKMAQIEALAMCLWYFSCGRWLREIGCLCCLMAWAVPICNLSLLVRIVM